MGICLFFPPPRPSTFSYFIRLLSVINLDFLNLSSAECVVPFPYWQRMLVAAAVPLVILLALLIFYVVPRYDIFARPK